MLYPLLAHQWRQGLNEFPSSPSWHLTFSNRTRENVVAPLFELITWSCHVTSIFPRYLESSRACYTLFGQLFVIYFKRTASITGCHHKITNLLGVKHFSLSTSFDGQELRQKRSEDSARREIHISLSFRNKLGKSPQVIYWKLSKLIQVKVMTKYRQPGINYKVLCRYDLDQTLPVKAKSKAQIKAWMSLL